MQDTQDTQEQQRTARSKPLFITDVELAALVGVSPGFLQTDRRKAQRIPFIKLGDRCLYDPEVALAAIRAMTVGGPRGRRAKRQTEAA